MEIWAGFFYYNIFIYLFSFIYLNLFVCFVFLFCLPCKVRDHLVFCNVWIVPSYSIYTILNNSNGNFLLQEKVPSHNYEVIVRLLFWLSGIVAFLPSVQILDIFHCPIKSVYVYMYVCVDVCMYVCMYVDRHSSRYEACWWGELSHTDFSASFSLHHRRWRIPLVASACEMATN